MLRSSAPARQDLDGGRGGQRQHSQPGQRGAEGVPEPARQGAEEHDPMTTTPSELPGWTVVDCSPDTVPTCCGATWARRHCFRLRCLAR